MVKNCANCKHLQDWIDDEEIACDFHCSFFYWYNLCEHWEDR